MFQQVATNTNHETPWYQQIPYCCESTGLNVAAPTLGPQSTPSWQPWDHLGKQINSMRQSHHQHAGSASRTRESSCFTSPKRWYLLRIQFSHLGDPQGKRLQPPSSHYDPSRCSRCCPAGFLGYWWVSEASPLSRCHGRSSCCWTVWYRSPACSSTSMKLQSDEE